MTGCLDFYTKPSDSRYRNPDAGTGHGAVKAGCDWRRCVDWSEGLYPARGDNRTGGRDWSLRRGFQRCARLFRGGGQPGQSGKKEKIIRGDNNGEMEN